MGGSIKMCQLHTRTAVSNPGWAHRRCRLSGSAGKKRQFMNIIHQNIIQLKTMNYANDEILLDHLRSAF